MDVRTRWQDLRFAQEVYTARNGCATKYSRPASEGGHFADSVEMAGLREGAGVSVDARGVLAYDFAMLSHKFGSETKGAV